MELTELKNKMFDLLKIADFNELKDKLTTILFDNELKQQVFDNWLEFCPDLTKDYMQIIYQYWMADRTKGKSQDFTPPCLGKLISKLCGETETVVDMCSGSGSLPIQNWNENKDAKFICLELDENVIPFLLFNLAIRNIEGEVIHCDVISGEVFGSYKLKRAEKYSEITTGGRQDLNGIKADGCISNPPYNAKWERPVFAQLQPRFNGWETPPEGNANYVFVLSALNFADKAVLILPCGLAESSNKTERKIAEQLLEANFIEAVITCPINMFEATGISVCILALNKRKKSAKVEFVDMRNCYETEIREQRGQFGGKSHTNRVYKKEINIFTDEHIKGIIDCISQWANIKERCAAVGISQFKENKYSLSPAKYIDFDLEKYMQPPEHRDFTDIVKDLNRVIEKRNCCKLTINETIAKSIGFDVEAFKDGNKPMGNEEFLEKLTGVKLTKPNYITFTRNKNEVKFENNSKEEISEVFLLIFQIWKHSVFVCNNEENRLLAELRDALLPELMSGEIDVSEIELSEQEDI